MYQASFLIGLCVGAAFAGASLWVALRKSAETAATKARSESQIEIARATEKLTLQAAQLQSLQSTLASAESRTNSLQQQVQECNTQRARIEERASRLEVLQQEIEAATADNERLQREMADTRANLARAESTASTRGTQLANLGEEVLSLSKKRDELVEAQSKLRAQVAQLTTTLEGERMQTGEKLLLLNEARDQLTATFRALAGDILEEKSQRFTDLNKANLAQILDPLRTKIQEFQAQVENVYSQESKDRTALGEQVRQLIQLNQRLSDDANNLTEALKGSSKTLGNWGEMILERILETSGLRKGSEYQMRPTYTRPDGRRAQPDAVVLLPENRSLVLDSKASLHAYDEYVRAENDDSRNAALIELSAALRTHLNDLSISDYQGLPDLNAPDFVVMFVPIEPAFIVAVTNDRKLWEDAWKKSVLLVSPTSLLFVIRIVANLWTQEAQKKHFQETAQRGASLYDKLVGFVEDFQAIGEGLEGAQGRYESALSKLCTGKGNAIRQAEMLKELGVRPSKSLPSDVLELSSEEAALSEVSPGPVPSESDG